MGKEANVGWTGNFIHSLDNPGHLLVVVGPTVNKKHHISGGITTAAYDGGELGQRRGGGGCAHACALSVLGEGKRMGEVGREGA